MYTVYIPSKGRSSVCVTALVMRNASIRFFIVVEPLEFDAYASIFGKNSILTLPEDGRGIAFSRSWIKQYSILKGEAYHYQIDDNIFWFGTYPNGKRKRMEDKSLKTCFFKVMEKAASEFSNIGIYGAAYSDFAFFRKNEISFNCCYSCVLIKNSVKVYWRPNCVDDVDYSLQVLRAGQCTMVFNRLLVQKRLSDGGLTPDYIDTVKRRAVMKGHQALWPGYFEYKEHFVVRRSNGELKRFPMFRLKPSRIWKLFKRTPIRNRNLLTSLLSFNLCN